MGGFSILDPQDISDVEAVLLDEAGHLRCVPFSDIAHFSQPKLSLFCLKHGVYQIVTDELVEFLGGLIDGFAPVIEIGAGNGVIGRSLGIPITDSRMQERLEIRQIYKEMGQGVCRYQSDVERLDGLNAIRRYKPQAVIGAWVTHLWKPGITDTGNQWGVDMLKLSQMVERYILIGNEGTHLKNEVFTLDADVKGYAFPWLISRSMDLGANRIWVFDFNRG